MAKRDWRKNAELVEEPLVVGVWYRSPLSKLDHCLGRAKEWQADGVSWCGFSLEAARDWHPALGEEWGGLWFTNRASAHCSECARMEREYAS